MYVFLPGPLAVDLEGDSVENIENRHKKVLQPGGRWRPNDCIAKQKVALLIPYRDRESDLQIFFNNIHIFLQKQYLHYGIYLIEQVTIEVLVCLPYDNQFIKNKFLAMLCNILRCFIDFNLMNWR